MIIIIINLSVLHYFCKVIQMNLIQCFYFFILQVLPDRLSKTGSNRWVEAEGCHPERGWRNYTVQAGEPYSLRVGDPRSTSCRSCLLRWKYPKCQLYQQVRLVPLIGEGGYIQPRRVGSFRGGGPAEYLQGAPYFFQIRKNSVEY